MQEKSSTETATTYNRPMGSSDKFLWSYCDWIVGIGVGLFIATLTLLTFCLITTL